MNRLRLEVEAQGAGVPRMRGDEPVCQGHRAGLGNEFPAYAGMNRSRGRRSLVMRRVPRMRGDEPQLTIAAMTDSREFPACAGMNRSGTSFPGRLAASSPLARG